MKKALSRKNLWEAAPSIVRKTLGRVLGFIPSRYLLGADFRKAAAFVETAQWWSADQAAAYQLRHLQRVTHLANQRSAYYRCRFREAGFEPGDLKQIDDFRRLPTINRQTIHDHLDEMITTDPHDPRIDYVTTGGTSGETLRFYAPRDRSATEWAYLISAWRRAGYLPDMPLAVLRGRPLHRNGHWHEYDPILRFHYYSNFDMTDDNMGRYLAHIAALGPCFLHVYPSSVATLASFMRRRCIPMPRNIRGVLAESENVYPGQRAIVETVFPVRYFSSYGHSEKLVAAAECEHSTRYHVWPTYGHCELLDEQGRPLTRVGARGEIVGTGFLNTVTPFIRYRTGDLATLAGDRCDHCGRQHMLLERVEGHHRQEMLVAADRSLISWTAINMHDDTFDGVRQFQFFQETPGQVTLRIVPENGFGKTDVDRVQHQLGDKLVGRITLDIVVCEHIELSPSGKAIYVDQRLAAARVTEP